MYRPGLIVRGFDIEGELIAPGRVCTQLVCAAYYDGQQMHTYERARIVPRLLDMIRDKQSYYVNQNPFFDLAVVANLHPEVLPDIFQMFDEGRVYCTKVAEQLIRIAQNEQTDRLSLGDLVQKYFKTKLEGKKNVDAWRFRYAELEGLPIEEYPAEARDYVQDDVWWALKVFKAQGTPKPTFDDQMRAGWAFYLAGVNGVRVDPWISQQLHDYVEVQVVKDTEYLIEQSIYRPDGAENKFVVKELVVRDYGGYQEGLWQSRVGVVESEPSSDLLSRLADDVERVETDSDRLLRFIQAQHDTETEKSLLYIWQDLKKAAPDEFELLKTIASLTTPRKISFTPKEGIQTSKTVLAGASDERLKRRAAAGTMKKLWEQYVPLLRMGERYPINPFWNVLVNSGRSSCGNPNLQNLPQLPGIREAFIPHLPGWVYITSDYTTAEMRSLAEVCYRLFGYSKLGDAINDKEDPHTKFVSGFLKIAYKDAARLVKDGDKLANKLRKLAKALNFGLPGGLGADKFVVFAYGQGVVVAEYAPLSYWPDGVMDLKAPWEVLLDVGVRYFKEVLKPEWLDMYPEIREYFAYMGQVCKAPYGLSDDEKREWYTTYVHPITGFVRGDVQYCSGCNHNFQHLTAAGAKNALYRVARECYVDTSSPLFGCRIVAFIHDEIIIEAPEDIAHEAGKQLERVMKECMDVFTPRCLSATDATIMRRWRKGAKEKFRDGRLIPYEDRDLSDEEVEKIRAAKNLWHAVIDGGVEPKRAQEIRG